MIQRWLAFKNKLIHEEKGIKAYATLSNSERKTRYLILKATAKQDLSDIELAKMLRKTAETLVKTF